MDSIAADVINKIAEFTDAVASIQAAIAQIEAAGDSGITDIHTARNIAVGFVAATALTYTTAALNEIKNAKAAALNDIRGASGEANSADAQVLNHQNTQSRPKRLAESELAGDGTVSLVP